MMQRSTGVGSGATANGGSSAACRWGLGLLLCACLAALAPPALADPPSHLASALSPPGIIPNGNFTNLYLWPDPEKETWNEHLAKEATLIPAETDSAATTATINGITTTFVGSSFFDLLTQYDIEPPTFSGEQTTTQECVNQVLQNAKENEGILQWEGESKFVGCEKSHSAINSAQVNVFVSPDIKAAKFEPFAGVRPDMCTQQVTAYHSADPSVADFTLIPTNTKCNSGLASLSESIGHEMVETLSDPSLEGYINESVSPRVFAGNFQQDFGQGELGDICQEGGLHPTPETSFESPFGTLQFGPWWSNADAACQPRRLMNVTLAELIGASKLADGSKGLFRMTGAAHTLPVPLVDPPAVAKHFLQQLELEVRTGGDNINSGNELNNGVTVQLSVKTSKAPIVLERVNQGQEWANNSLHAVLLRVPAGIALDELTGMKLVTKFNGNDNWDIKDVFVKAAVACGSSAPNCTEQAEPPECPLAREKSGAPPPGAQPRPLLEKKGATLLPDGTKGLKRLTGTEHELTSAVTIDPAFANLLVNRLVLEVHTGGDNLKGGSGAGENASAVLTLDNGVRITYPDINQRQEWSNNSSSGTIELPVSSLPAGTTLNDIKSLSIVTNFENGDNWDILGLSLEAQVACALGVHPLPKPVSFTSVEAIGNAELPDGSKGLFRETGEQHTFSLGLAPAPPPIAGKVVTALELTIKTGGDDLRAGNAPQDNANAVLVVGGKPIEFVDINSLQKWNNETEHTVDLLTLGGLPAGTKLSEITGPLELKTKFEGGTEGDNWDIKNVTLKAFGD